MLIDTNVWSELARREPEPVVVRFLAAHSRSAVLSTIVLAEIEYGIAKAADPVHRRRLVDWLDGVMARCAGRVIEPDAETATIWGKLKADLERRGEPIADMDLMIAAQAIGAAIPLVTRNVSDMVRTGATIINPWQA